MSWTLSEDKKKYYKTIYGNYSTENTEFVDLFGNVSKISLDYSFEKVPEASYQYSKILNCEKEIMVIVNATMPMQETKASWTLSDDSMSYFKVYSQNYETNTAFTDNNSFIKYLNIKIEEIKSETIPNIAITYNNNLDGSVTVTVNSSKKLQDTKLSWKLSADRYTYSKTYYENYVTNSKFTDIFDNTTQYYDIIIESIRE